MAENFLTNRIGLAKIPEISYIIFTTPRSGSTFFCDALRKTGLAGRPGEHFLHWYRTECRPEQINPMEAPFRMLPPVLQMRRAIKNGTRNGVFGVKVMYPYYSFVERSIRNLTDFPNQPAKQVLESFFPNLHYIHLSRRSKIRQAVSLTRALQLNDWKKNSWSPFVHAFNKIHTGGKKSNELLYDFDKIHAFYQEMSRQDREWEVYFNASAIQPCQVIYEDLFKHFDESMAEVLRYLGRSMDLKLKVSDVLLKRQSDAVNEEWSERFQRDLARTGQTTEEGTHRP